MERAFATPKGHWSMPVDIPYAMGVRAGHLVFTCGQCDLDERGNVLNEGDLAAQTESSVAHIARVLAEFGAGLEDLVRLGVFYVNDGGLDEDAYLARIAAMLPGGARPVITAIPLPCFYYPGLMVEPEAVAAIPPDRAPLPREAARPSGHWPLPFPFAHGLELGDMIFVGAQAPRDAQGRVVHVGDVVGQTRAVVENLSRVLAEFDATLADAVKVTTFYAGGADADAWAECARVRAAAFPEPGPAATAIPLPRLLPEGALVRMELIAMRRPEGAPLARTHVRPEEHWDWPIPVPFSQGVGCGGLFFVGGQVSADRRGRPLHAGDLAAQTNAVMDNIAAVLSRFGLGFADVVKVNAYYRGGPGDGRLHENLALRSARFERPGPASTGVAVPALAIEGLEIEVDCIAVGR